MARPTPSFDRIRPRVPSQPSGPRAGAQPGLAASDLPRQPARGRDPLGLAALYSPTPPPPLPLGSVRVSCARCGTVSVVTLMAAVRLALPSLHLPGLLAHPSFMRCPACGRRSWVRVSLRG